MSDEMDILKIVGENPNISQRKIAQQVGVSLGQVNFLIKKCAKKGFIKIEGQTSKSLKYNLTPKGLAEKTALTLQYVKMSYAAVIALSDKIRELVDQYELQGKRIYVFGEQDEMMEICRLALGSRALYVNSKSEIVDPKSEIIVLHWKDNDHDLQELNEYEAVNLLL